jgi:hypothetical protein
MVSGILLRKSRKQEYHDPAEKRHQQERGTETPEADWGRGSLEYRSFGVLE